MKHHAVPLLLVFASTIVPLNALAQHRVPSPPSSSQIETGSRLDLTATAPSSGAAIGVADVNEPTYGAKIRQIVTDGVGHNIYYHRNPWNADNSYLIGIQSDNQQRNWWVALYSGAGTFIKRLFSIDQYDWRLVWDRHNPDLLYTWKGDELYHYHVASGRADLLKTFRPLWLRPNGPSLNQDGTRILVVTSDGAFRSYRLPDMTDAREFRVDYPLGCATPWKDERYTGYRNYVSSACASGDYAIQALLVYDDDGRLVHTFKGVAGGGHYDFSPDGQLAYFTFWSAGSPLEIHVASVDGNGDRVVFRASATETRYLQNLHLSWPDNVSDWFIASFFPSAMNMPDQYSPLVDEIAQIRVDGAYKFLCRSGTREGRRETAFWAEPLASPSADGSRLSFNSNRSGQIQQYILRLSK